MIKRNERLISLDVFRGGVIAGFLFQNNLGSDAHVYSQLAHAQWQGWTIADLGFPIFLFIVGVSLSFSLTKLQENNVKKYDIYKKVLIRSSVIFLLGLFLENFMLLVDFSSYSLENFSSIRIMGILQRIALTYLIASIIFIETENFSTVFLWTGTFIVGYWILMTEVPVPGHGAGDLSRSGNLATYIDNLVMPDNLWKNHFDPEGLLSTIPAAATVLIGSLTGIFLQSGYLKRKRAAYLAAAGIFCLVTGLIADQWFPINKSLWSSSFVLFTGGISLLILSALYWIIEIKGIKNWAKLFKIFGINCLVIFMLSILTTSLIEQIGIPVSDGYAKIRMIIFYHVLSPVMAPKLASLVYGLLHLTFWSALIWYLYKRKIFIRT